jgi:ABC-type transporter Mla subunit MlaD
MGSNAVRVGLAVMGAFVLLMFATFSLRRVNVGATYLRRVAFADAQGIQEGAFVRVRGVNKGTVEEVNLGSPTEAVLTLRMRSDYQIEPDDSVRIVGGLFSFSPPYVEITPGGRKTAMSVAPDGTFQGEATATTDSMMSQSNELITRLNSLTERLTRLTDSVARVAENPRVQNNLIRMSDNFAKASESGRVVAHNMIGVTEKADRLLGSFGGTADKLDRTLAQSEGLIRTFNGAAADTRELMKETRTLVRTGSGVMKDTGELVRSTNTVVQNAGGLVTDTRGTLAENRERVAALFESLNRSLKSLDETLEHTKTFVGDPELRGDLKATAANLKDATENLKGISQDVRGLTGDPKVQEDLRASLGSLKTVAQSASEVLERARAVLGTPSKTAKTLGQRVQEATLDLNAQRGFQSQRTRLDFNAVVPWSATTYYRLGFYDFGETNKFNVQAGQRIRSGIHARYGFYASKLGAGLDFGSPVSPAFSADLFGVDNPQLDLRTNFRIAPHLDIRLGLEDIFRRPDPVFGVRYVRY